MYHYDDTKPLDDDNVAEILTEIMAVQLGPIHMLTVPGELAPELGIGGYDGSHVNAPGRSLVDPDNPNPPDLSAAPEPPYLVDRMGGTHNWIVGLGNDELGYILPEYDFQVDDLLPYIERPEGDHYEETNSLSPEFAGILDAEAAALLGWVPAR